MKAKIFPHRLLLIGLAGWVFQANAYELPVVEDFLMLVAVRTAPITVCPLGSYHSSYLDVDCVSRTRPDDGEDKVVRTKPVSVRKYLEDLCPGAILRSITPAIYTTGPSAVQRVVNNFAVGFEPPPRGCHFAPKPLTNDDGSF